MIVGIAHVTFVAAAIFAVGAYVSVRDVVPGSWSRGPVLMFAAAALELAGVSRFAGSTRDPLSGQAFAILLLLLVPAFTALVALARVDEP